MTPKNVLNIEKKGKIIGNVFHLFYSDISKSILFDSDFSSCIIYGNKSIVMTQLKNIDKLMNIDNQSRVIIFSYIMSSAGYKKIDMYNGPIETIGKYIRRY